MDSIIGKIIGQDETLVNLIDLKFHDDYTFFHSVNVAILSLLMGVELNLKKDELLNLGLSAILHDIGKMFVRNEVLDKVGRLEPLEIKEIQHHERYDGKGYPDGAAGKDIHLFGRIISIADVYDELTANRPFRESMNASEAIRHIIKNQNILFDGHLTNIFIKKVAPYPVGTYVRLNSGHSGIVFKNSSNHFDRPIVKLIVDRLGNRIKPMYVDLKREKQLQKVRIIGSNEMNVVEMIQNCS